jgi:hypothetical protein
MIHNYYTYFMSGCRGLLAWMHAVHPSCVEKTTLLSVRCIFATVGPRKTHGITHFFLDKKRPVNLYSGVFFKRGKRGSDFMRPFHSEGALAIPVALLPDPHPVPTGRGLLPGANRPEDSACG